MVVAQPTFVDTNVFLYHWDASDPSKQRAAGEWIRVLADGRHGRVSFQVLAEFYVNATQKLRKPLDRGLARDYVRDLFAWMPVRIDGGLLDAAWLVQERFQLSWWDALVVAAAYASGCRTLLSEDFQAGQDFDGLRVVNPFATAP